MSDIDDIFARSLHHASKTTEFGEAFAPPIVNTSVYRLADDPSGPYQYARWGNPTWTALEDSLSILEDAETVTFPSGMAAIAALLYSTLKSGDRVLLPSDGYYTVRLFAEKYLLSIGVTVDHCPTSEVAARSLAGYRVVWIETPSNPGLDLADIAAVARNAKAAGALLAVDNTTMTPLGQRPLDLGADAVVSADTKALNGHSDVLFGHVSSRNAQLIGGRARLAEDCRSDSRPVRSMARASRTRNARGSHFANVRQRAGACAAAGSAPESRCGSLSGFAIASGARAGAEANDERR